MKPKLSELSFVEERWFIYSFKIKMLLEQKKKGKEKENKNPTNNNQPTNQPKLTKIPNQQNSSRSVIIMGNLFHLTTDSSPMPTHQCSSFLLKTNGFYV